jgi:hypothetical protein
LWIVLFAVACSRASGSAAHEGKRSPLLTADEPAVVQIDVDRAAKDPSEALRAATTPHHEGKLGAHRFAGTTKLRVNANGAEVESLDEATSIEADAKGAYHATYTNSRDYGREAFFTPSPATMWLRPRYGKFHRRPPVGPDEPPRVADEIYGSFGAQLELCANALSVTDGGPTTIAGRAARKITLTLGKETPRAPEKLPQRAWRDTIHVSAIDGEIDLDNETGALLGGRLAATLGYTRGGQAYEMKLEATHAVSDIGTAIAITPPGDDQSVDTPGRSHDFDDREELLDGLAPPAHRAPAPHDARDEAQPAPPAPAPAKDKDKDSKDKAP